MDHKGPFLSLNLKLLQLGGIYHPKTPYLIIRTWFNFYKYLVLITIIFGYTVVELIGKYPNGSYYAPGVSKLKLLLRYGQTS